MVLRATSRGRLWCVWAPPHPRLCLPGRTVAAAMSSLWWRERPDAGPFAPCVNQATPVGGVVVTQRRMTTPTRSSRVEVDLSLLVGRGRWTRCRTHKTARDQLVSKPRPPESHRVSDCRTFGRCSLVSPFLSRRFTTVSGLDSLQPTPKRRHGPFRFAVHESNELLPHRATPGHGQASPEPCRQHSESAQQSRRVSVSG